MVKANFQSGQIQHGCIFVAVVLSALILFAVGAESPGVDLTTLAGETGEAVVSLLNPVSRFRPFRFYS